jgi:hypothetical protein
MNENNCRKKRRRAAQVLRYGMFLIGVLFAFVVGGSPVLGAELTVPFIQAKAGQDIRFPVVVDKIDRLAGIKLIIHYTKELLTFTGGVRSQSTDSMMHVVNDKIPGKLIVVMAAARGIGGNDITLITLNFSVKKGLAGSAEAVVDIADVQLMGDDLKDIPCKGKSGKIAILP